MADREKSSCRICGNTAGNQPFVVREMMFGLREPFQYFECSQCGCIQITSIPTDLSKYYPPDYYSFQPPSRLKILIKGPWLCEAFSIGTTVKRILSVLPGMRFIPEWMGRARIKRNQAILEVGSGFGHRAIAMRQAGFRNVTGIDPFIAEERRLVHGVEILKKEIHQLDSSFDLVMLHHVLEHLPDQQSTLRHIARILRPGGTVLIRIPIASYAWRKYGVHWFQLDAPRHFYIHTLASFKRLAAESGFTIVDLFFDSDAAQFWGSEQYARDIPLRAAPSYLVNPRRSIFSAAQIRAFAKEARRLNRKQLGDSAAFYLCATPRLNPNGGYGSRCGA
jgi:SAM-dependent methyltransferase